MVKSADRVIQILEAVGLAREGVTHGDLVSALNIPKSSLSSLLSTLVDSQYLSLEKSSKRYELGSQILVMAGRYLHGLDVVKLGQPLLREITGVTDESSEIAIKRGHDIVIVCKEDSSRPVARVIQIGDRAPMYATAAGKAILAHLQEEETAKYFSSVDMAPLTKNTITDPIVLQKELKRIRSGALARSNEELDEGVVALAAPVFDFHGQVVASVVVPVPAMRFTKERQKDIERALRSGAMELSHLLGWDSRAEKRMAGGKGK
ncbi:MAG: IclR family transcriptional regulator [Deltaproteobacteria bacterium]|nr:IclR family transcriptional regulator [Deltaproteobacteria bacterium]